MGDFEAVVELHVAGLVGTFDAAVIEKDSDGKVHVHKTELPTQHGAWTGIGVGAVLGILFPPSIIATTVAGGVIGGVTGHTLDEGQAAIVVIGESKVDEQIEKATKRAKKMIEKQIDADADELKKQIEAA